jgi:ferredoxin
MAFDFKKFFSTPESHKATATNRKVVVKPHNCPQNHPCPALRACPVGAITQKGYAAPVIDYAKCTACGRCNRYCFMGALILEKN